MDDTLEIPARAAALRLRSGPPWDLLATVERTGGEYVCTIRRGASSAVARTRARWLAGRASVTGGTGGSQDERRIATEIAHKLCRAARSNTSVHVSLGAEPDEAERNALLQDASRVGRTLARRIADLRIREALTVPGSLATRLVAPAESVERRIRAHMATPWHDLRARYEAATAGSGSTPTRRRVLLFAPLYLSNACLNDCVYCGFRKSARADRTHLSVEHALADARHLAARGHRTLDLVSGEIPTDAFIAHAAAACTAILQQSPIERIHLNLGALTLEQYANLRRAGARGYHLYQETYDPDVYLAVHREGPKRDMAHRLLGAHRALQAGFESIGLGVLLGLAPVTRDLARLVRHARVLQHDFPDAGIGFSLPRVQEAGQLQEELELTPVDDATFMKALLFLRLEFPGAHITLTTRESPELRDAMLPLGISKVSAGVSTAPGGYEDHGSENAPGSPQFSIQDDRSLAEVAAGMRAAGLDPAFH